ncbi:uncharacterized protein LOC114562117 [Perca flavescens]|uniref:uncharacterized protein LOC114562117 n=1 Tax=Perca flavescens TaxID=8167 RepID=UPI00106ED109|nr:uncharacterized protein LOC114562117 [Perca flavescens]
MESARVWRNPVCCLICKTSQDQLSTHLARVCMKDCNPEERNAELQRAKESQLQWARKARIWDYADLSAIVQDDPTCRTLTKTLLQRGFLVTNVPLPAATATSGSAEEPGTSSTRQSLSSTGKCSLLNSFKATADDTCCRLQRGETVDEGRLADLRNFCIAFLVLELRKTTRQVRELTVHEWFGRARVNQGAVVKMTAARGVEDNFTLTLQQEAWFSCYMDSIRSVYLKSQAVAGSDQDRFFLGKNGTPLTHATTVIDRFCRRHGPLEDEGSTSTVVSGKRKASMTWDNFLDEFPITLHGVPPSQEESKAKGYEGGRVFYHKWRDMQRKLRMDYILMDHPHQRPSEARVRYQLQREGWTSNAPKLDEILACWKSKGGSVLADPNIMQSVLDQKWKGLAIIDLGPPKGKGVVATMPFQAGDVVCDYHGELVTEAEGRQRQSHVPDGTDMYFFYFRSHSGARMCLDAQKFPCPCHPSIDTFGRRMNHSNKNFNVKPVRLALPFSGGLRDSMIFVATRNVTVKEELTWDYGVRPSSFGGEGWNLEWLNE